MKKLNYFLTNSEKTQECLLSESESICLDHCNSLATKELFVGLLSDKFEEVLMVSELCAFEFILAN